MPHRTQYGAVANFYDAILTLSGFKRSVEKFLGGLELRFSAEARILDAGCGTGLISMFLAERFPDATIHAFDIDAAMLRELERIVIRRKIDTKKFIIARGDLETPEALEVLRTRERINIPNGYFDAIFVSGALEHVDLDGSLRRLAQLLKPGGMFFNLGMRKNPAGSALGMVYRFKPYGVAEMRRACEAAGLANVRTLRLAGRHFPANLSRVATIAEKPEAGN